MIRSQHNIFIYSFFKLYTVWKIHRNFHEIKISGEFRDKGFPVLLIAHHISWWDGFWAMYLNLKVFHRKFHFMMQQEQLDKYSFFKRTGGFPVKTGSKSILETLRHASELLTRGRNLVLIFPQGEIQSLYRRDYRFKKGTARILKNIPNPVHIVFVVNLVDFFSQPKPSLFISFREYSSEATSIEIIEEEYNAFYTTCMDAHINMTMPR